MMSASISRITQSFLLAGIEMAPICACGNKGKYGKNATSEVAATVGSEEISALQINQMPSQTNVPGIAFQDAAAIRPELHEKLIDQQFAWPS